MCGTFKIQKEYFCKPFACILLVLKTGVSRLSKPIFSTPLESAPGERTGKIYFRANQKFSNSCTHAGHEPFTQIVALAISVNTEEESRNWAVMRKVDFHLQSR